LTALVLKKPLSDYSKSPSWIFKVFSGYFDVCPKNPTFDGLSIPWKKRNYCNPPYSNKSPWIKKAIQEQKKGNITVMLLPHDTSSAYYHDLIVPNAELLILRGRLRLDGKSHPRFPSIFVIFHP